MITKCPDCKKVFEVDPSWETQEVTCDSCNKDFLVKKYIDSKLPTTISETSDEAVLNSISPSMRFWIRFSSVLMLVRALSISFLYGPLILRLKNIPLATLYGCILILFVFFYITAANMMSNSVNSEFKITYNMFHKIFALLFFIFVLVEIVITALVGFPAAINVVWFCGTLVIAYTYFVSWKLYKRRAVAQAEEIVKPKVEI